MRFPLRPAAPRRRARAAALLLLAVPPLLPACASRGRELDAELIPEIRRGVTTQAQIRDWFGPPVKIDVFNGNRERWYYVTETTRTRGTGTLTKIGRSIASILGRRAVVPPVDVRYRNTVRQELEVYFDPTGVVTNFRYGREEMPSREVY